MERGRKVQLGYLGHEGKEKVVIVRCQTAILNAIEKMKKNSPIDFSSFLEKKQECEKQEMYSQNVEDGTCEDLAFRLYRENDPVEDLVVVYHGGGVSMDAGYSHLASYITSYSSIAVCLIDIRGHGNSGGKRGHTPDITDVWADVDKVIWMLRARIPTARIHLLGHSSGAGLLLNYLTQYPHSGQVHSLIFLAPELGPSSGVTRRAGSDSGFAKIRKWPFLLHALTGGRLCGATTAVTLDFAGIASSQSTLFVHAYTVNMSLALTPMNAAQQLREIDKPITIIAAGRDELFDPEKMASLVARNASDVVRYECLEHATHLDIILSAGPRVVGAIIRLRTGEG